MYWLHSFNESGAKFISGTISPSRSTNTQLEPLASALAYYTNNNVSKVILQPKWMGSRLQVYLHKNTNKDFAITRNGSRCGQAEKMKLIFQKLHNQYDSIISYHDCLILDGELLPWSFIGQELINKEFSQYSSCIEQELICLQQDKIYQNLFPNNNIKQQLNGINIFKEQLSLYASVSEPIFKGFNILSIDGQIQKNQNQENIYQLLGNS